MDFIIYILSDLWHFSWQLAYQKCKNVGALSALSWIVTFKDLLSVWKCNIHTAFSLKCVKNVFTIDSSTYKNLSQLLPLLTRTIHKVWCKISTHENICFYFNNPQFFTQSLRNFAKMGYSRGPYFDHFDKVLSWLGKDCGFFI